MSAKRISQRAARAWRRRAELAERTLYEQRCGWAGEWPGGVHIGTVSWNDLSSTAREVLTARRLGHAVVAVADGDRKLMLYALPLGTKA